MINLADVSPETVHEVLLGVSLEYARVVGQNSDAAAGFYVGISFATVLLTVSPELLPLLNRALACGDADCPEHAAPREMVQEFTSNIERLAAREARA